MKKNVLWHTLWVVFCCLYFALVILNIADVYKTPDFLDFLLHALFVFGLAQLIEDKKWAAVMYVVAAIHFVLMVVALIR